MSVSVKVEVTGIQESIARCQRVIANFDRVIPETFQSIGGQIVEEMKGKAPVKTGFLRDNITLEQANIQQLRIVSGAPYSIFVEFGTYKMQPREFFYSTVFAYIPEIVQIIAPQVIV